MAMDVKSLLSYELLDWYEQTPKEKLTIGKLLDKSGVSRQTFYRYFRDLNDLICYAYAKNIMGFVQREHDATLHVSPDREEYFRNILLSYQKQEKYLRFLQSACASNEQNSLRHYAVERSIEIEGLQAMHRFGLTQLTPRQHFALELNANGLYDIWSAWILSGMKSMSKEDLASYVTEARFTIIDHFMKETDPSK